MIVICLRKQYYFKYINLFWAYNIAKIRAKGLTVNIIAVQRGLGGEKISRLPSEYFCTCLTGFVAPIEQSLICHWIQTEQSIRLNFAPGVIALWPWPRYTTASHQTVNFFFCPITQDPNPGYNCHLDSWFIGKRTEQNSSFSLIQTK